jgi:Protein of unknown function (DUF3182)
MSAAGNERSVVMTRGMVVIHFSRLGGRLDPHQKVMLDADAKVIAHVLGYDFGGRHQAARDYAAPVFFVPDDTLLVDEASSLGIRGPNDFYGGVVPHPFIKTKAITHGPVEENAERAPGWSAAFAERVSEIVLPGYTVFSAGDARTAAKRMLRRGGIIRVKNPLGASGKGQTLVTTLQELDALLETYASEEMATYGLVLEENLRQVRTLSVGHIAIDGLTLAYFGVQRSTKDNEGRSVYGGSDLVCVRGGWDALDALAVEPDARAGVAEARLYDQAMSEYPGFMASRRNYDIGQGIDSEGRPRSGVFESSWRIGGASPAELLALTEFAQDPSAQVIEAAHVAEFGKHREAPAGAVVHFEGDDPQAGPLIRYTIVTRRK